MIPIIPDSAPFTPEQRAWLNGFLAGALGLGAPAAAIPPAAPAPSLLVLFGSQGGNAEGLAKKVGREAGMRGFSARVAGLDTLAPAALAREKNVLLITSTWGEGEMPDNAAAFWDGLNQNGSSPQLPGVNYAVLALGDTNYGETFCLAGRKLDERLAELGATRLHPRVECDVDFDAPAQAWTDAVFSKLGDGGSGPATTLEIAPAPAAEEQPTGWSKKNPFPATLITNEPLNAPGSAKDTRHLEFSLQGSGLDYQVGDALGIVPQNNPVVVDAVIAAHHLDPSTPVPLPDGGQAALREALITHYEVRGLLGKTAAAAPDPAAFVEGLKKLQPRLYSISSSPKAHPGQVHLTVAVVRYEKDGLQHEGVASTFIADRLGAGGKAGVFFQKSPHFRLPENPETPVIMVGPGTGIAPFRAFLEERQASGAPGRNWLFFGDQRAATDFLYRGQLEQMQKDGILTRLDLAFSRDQEQKVYVQSRMEENAAELFRWLEDGAHFYVCGDASRMAKDVDAALHAIIETAGGRSKGAAAEYVAALKKAKRYQRDVY